MNWSIGRGRSWPLGTQLRDQGCNFAVYAPKAEKVWLCLFDGDKEVRLAMPDYGRGIWHGFVPGIQAGQAYGFRAEGQFRPSQGLWFNEHKFMLDPYSHALSAPVMPHPSQLAQHEGKIDCPNLTDSAPFLPRSLVVDHQFDWQDDPEPHHAFRNTVLYELHIKGFTKQLQAIPQALRGTYLGLAQPAAIEHLKRMRITAVQIMPVQAFATEPRLAQMGLVNYWGYNPVCFMAPDPRYAVKDAVSEFKTMVKALHQAGIEVILDVVFNHTAEGGHFGPTFNHKGLHADVFYRLADDNPGQFIDHSGCGNSVSSHRSYALREIMDSLRHWREQYHIDGFRFDLAASLGREPLDYDQHCALFRTMTQDPCLVGAKLIAEPWDIGMGGYQLGNFPPQWYECNDKFRDRVRAFWRGDEFCLPDFCTRIMGSRDLFEHQHGVPTRSLNYVTYHDGFTLHDLVSYSDKHNQANGEHNRDGHGHNYNYNHGVEGPTKDPKILAIRRKQQRNMLATVLLSQGAVHLLGGDETMHSQHGNNNAYCQDNPITWKNWQLRPEQEEHCQFVEQMIRIRQSSRLFHDLSFTKTELLNGPAHSRKVHWYNELGQEMTIADWHDNRRQHVSLLLSSSEPRLNAKDGLAEEAFLILFNSSDQAINMRLPGSGWLLMLDTDKNNGLMLSSKKSISGQYLIEGKSLALLTQNPSWYEQLQHNTKETLCK